MVRKPFESRIQDLVYNVDVGVGLRIIKVCLYALFVLVLLLLYTVTQFKGLDNAQAMDYAQLGRNVSMTGRFVTQYIRPASMWYLIEHSPEGSPQMHMHPDILHPPLYPALLAAGFKAIRYDFDAPPAGHMHSAEQWVIVPMGHICTLLTGLFIFLIALNLFDRRVAWIGMTLYYLSNTVWAHAISGSSISLVTLLCTAAFYFAVLSNAKSEPEERVSMRRRVTGFVLSALFCILAMLTRYGAVVLVPALGLYFYFAAERRRWLWALLFFVVCLAGISPWLIRNQMVSGGLLGLAPYTALSDTTVFPGDTFERTFAPVFRGAEVFEALRNKWLMQFAQLFDMPLRSIGDGFLVCLFIATFFYRFVRPRTHLLRWCLALALFLTMVIAAFFGENTWALLHMFWPLILLYGLVFFFMLLDRLDFELHLYNLAVLGVFMLLSTLPLIFALLPPRVGIPYPPYFPPYIRHVSGLLQPDELMCSDMPWANAWYGQRDTLHLPTTIHDFYEINDYLRRVRGLYFTSITRDKPYVRELRAGPYRSWFPILEGRIPSDFPLTSGFPIGDLDQLFLTDGHRWQRR